ncbi:hypothetical protein CBR_g57831 [Chara braunii]|uniref:Uncharacterized protein n=1 Tax=Chara braunii TaxID=69332 RepID=A0A388K862_CHABU|nr:hypothetical protein CBR_g57831 [Chara braunii]|eukprot:GBG66228.1 hypothetical protein CBR_g57831 [Chara braunii]
MSAAAEVLEDVAQCRSSPIPGDGGPGRRVQQKPKRAKGTVDPSDAASCVVFGIIAKGTVMYVHLRGNPACVVGIALLECNFELHRLVVVLAMSEDTVDLLVTVH